MRLEGRTAIVTGGSRGIGFAVARALLAEGASVAVIGTREDTIAAAAEELGRQTDPARVVGLKADVRRYADVEGACATVAGRFGGIDILVNNAGVGGFTPVAEMALEDWHRVIDTNLTAVFYCCRAALPYLRKAGGGWIVNVSSLASKNPFPNGAAYCASKSALNAFSEALMQEVRYDGVRVACVLPGSVNTGFGGLANTKAEWALMPEDVAAAVADLLAHPSRSLPSRVEIRPAQPPRKA
jgi:NAD(P)-dependent dehydrogenase (short-subunit alcohol dehydrogenase family)